jgi:hypothetical protein
MTENNNYTQRPRQVPANELDLQMQITTPGWQNLSPQLQEKLIKFLREEIIEGEPKKVYDQLSGILAIYTQDVRLGNLSTFNGEYDYVSYYLELAVDLLEAEQPQATVVALNRALAKLELSSSKGGFLRKLFNTIRSENLSKSLEPDKKRPFGNNRKSERNY